MRKESFATCIWTSQQIDYQPLKKKEKEENKKEKKMQFFISLGRKEVDFP